MMFTINLLNYLFSDSSLLSGLMYGDGNSPILLFSLDCDREQNLLECRRLNYVGYRFCYSNTNTVALRCDGKYARSIYMYVYIDIKFSNEDICSPLVHIIYLD